LRSNRKGHGRKTHKTDSQNTDTTAPSGRERRPIRKLSDTLSYFFYARDPWGPASVTVSHSRKWRLKMRKCRIFTCSAEEWKKPL